MIDEDINLYNSSLFVEVTTLSNDNCKLLLKELHIKNGNSLFDLNNLFKYNITITSVYYYKEIDELVFSISYSSNKYYRFWVKGVVNIKVAIEIIKKWIRISKIESIENL